MLSEHPENRGLRWPPRSWTSQTPVSRRSWPVCGELLCPSRSEPVLMVPASSWTSHLRCSSMSFRCLGPTSMTTRNTEKTRAMTDQARGMPERCLACAACAQCAHSVHTVALWDLATSASSDDVLCARCVHAVCSVCTRVLAASDLTLGGFPPVLGARVAAQNVRRSTGCAWQTRVLTLF